MAIHRHVNNKLIIQDINHPSQNQRLYSKFGGIGASVIGRTGGESCFFFAVSCEVSVTN
uniref:Uncharacterized protein n=1 Tax=Rhizophagus irregularis (strain DAOM 181602 / DAOM 197198 / MUCL 43194) TaxID=747089 RepID=U9U0V2_RHIID